MIHPFKQNNMLFTNCLLLSFCVSLSTVYPVTLSLSHCSFSLFYTIEVLLLLLDPMPRLRSKQELLYIKLQNKHCFKMLFHCDLIMHVNCANTMKVNNGETRTLIKKFQWFLCLKLNTCNTLNRRPYL